MDLRANTAVDVLIGPFVDSGDGNTTEDGLTLSRADIKLSKNGQALTQKTDITAAAFDDDGYYNCELDATDTNTEGNLVLIVHEAGALPVRHEYNVLAQAAWDSLYVAKDVGFMDVNIKTVGRADAQETEANNLESACSNYSVTRGLTGTALPAVVAEGAGGIYTRGSGAGQINQDNNGQIDTDLQRIFGTALSEGGAGRLAAAFVKLFDVASPVLTATSVNQGADNNTILSSMNIANGAVESDLTYIHGTALTETAGQLAASFKKLHDVATPVMTTENVNQGANNDTILSSLTIANGAVDSKITYIMDAILTEGGAGRLAAAFIKLFDVVTPLLVASDVMVGTDGANTTVPAVPGDAMNLAADAIKAVSYDESTAFPLTAVNGSTLTEAGGTGDHLTAINLPNQTMDIIGTLTGNLIGDVTGNVDGTVAGKTPAEPSDVNAQVLDVLNVDTFAEPGDEVPTATTTLVDKIGYLYKFLRNKVETTSTKIHVYDDAGTNKDQTSTISDNGTTFARGEFGAGDA